MLKNTYSAALKSGFQNVSPIRGPISGHRSRNREKNVTLIMVGSLLEEDCSVTVLSRVPARDRNSDGLTGLPAPLFTETAN